MKWQVKPLCARIAFMSITIAITSKQSTPSSQVPLEDGVKKVAVLSIPQLESEGVPIVRVDQRTSRETIVEVEDKRDAPAFYGPQMRPGEKVVIDIQQIDDGHVRITATKELLVRPSRAIVTGPRNSKMRSKTK